MGSLRAHHRLRRTLRAARKPTSAAVNLSEFRERVQSVTTLTPFVDSQRVLAMTDTARKTEADLGTYAMLVEEYGDPSEGRGGSQACNAANHLAELHGERMQAVTAVATRRGDGKFTASEKRAHDFHSSQVRLLRGGAALWDGAERRAKRPTASSSQARAPSARDGLAFGRVASTHTARTTRTVLTGRGT